MSSAQEVFVLALASVAPEVDVALIPVDADLRRAADLDSLDVLSLAEELTALTGGAVTDDQVSRLVTRADWEAFAESSMTASAGRTSPA